MSRGLTLEDRPYRPILGGKGRYKEDDSPMRRVWGGIKVLVPWWWTEWLIETAAERTRRIADRYGEPAFAWSGGKDSLALAIVMERAGVSRGLWAACPLDFGEFMDWARAHRPAGVECLWNEALSEDWLVEHPGYVFAAGSWGQHFTELHHRTPLHQAYAERALGVLFTGRRSQDKNPPSDPTRPTLDGRRTANPIYDWNHEEVMAAIAWTGGSLPPCYARYPGGWYDGPTCWNARIRPPPIGWEQTYDIDPALVHRLSTRLVGARQELERRGMV